MTDDLGELVRRLRGLEHVVKTMGGDDVVLAIFKEAAAAIERFAADRAEIEQLQSKLESEIERLVKERNASDVLQRIAAENSSDPASDDLTVPLAIKLAAAEQALAALTAAQVQSPDDRNEEDMTLAHNVRRAAIAGERERCAKIAENFYDVELGPQFKGALRIGMTAGKQIAEAIRAVVG